MAELNERDKQLRDKIVAAGEEDVLGAETKFVEGERPDFAGAKQKQIEAIERGELVDSLIKGLTQIYAGVRGEREGLDLSGIETSGPDFKERLRRRMSVIKGEEGRYARGRKERETLLKELRARESAKMEREGEMQYRTGEREERQKFDREMLDARIKSSEKIAKMSEANKRTAQAMNKITTLRGLYRDRINASRKEEGILFKNITDLTAEDDKTKNTAKDTLAAKGYDPQLLELVTEEGAPPYVVNSIAEIPLKEKVRAVGILEFLGDSESNNRPMSQTQSDKLNFFRDLDNRIIHHDIPAGQVQFHTTPVAEYRKLKENLKLAEEQSKGFFDSDEVKAAEGAIDRFKEDPEKFVKMKLVAGRQVKPTIALEEYFTKLRENNMARSRGEKEKHNLEGYKIGVKSLFKYLKEDK